MTKEKAKMIASHLRFLAVHYAAIAKGGAGIPQKNVGKKIRASIQQVAKEWK